MYRIKTTSSRLIIAVSILIIVCGNFSFLNQVLEVYPLNVKNGLFIASLAVMFACGNILVFSLVCYKYTLKPVLITVLLLSSLAAYFMDSYHVIIDDVMIDNIFNTDSAEIFDLVTIKSVLYFVLLGIGPSVLVYTTTIVSTSQRTAISARLILSGSCVGIVVLCGIFFGDSYASFFREHKPLRYHANPSCYVYSAGKYLNRFFKNKSNKFSFIGLDAKIPTSDEHRELIIFVVGETARADHFSLNGYRRKTNPLLEKESVISFKNFWACGTSTAISVPCMFSIYGRYNYDKNLAKQSDNVLDVLQRSGVNVVWFDNNSGSKGVADRVPFTSYKSLEVNTVCDIECRDEGMLVDLQQYIDNHTRGDIFIVLHQMGNHGPAYYKRYPAQFEIFTPTCQTNQLEQCSDESVINSYDNAIVYTDHFLAKAIKLLSKNNDQFESALFYVSDHGESLGENNMYLHGLPYWLAPDSQTNVPVIMWFSDSYDEDEIDFIDLKNNINKKYSHDNIFHTILGLMEVKTTVYDPEMDIIKHGHYK